MKIFSFLSFLILVSISTHLHAEPNHQPTLVEKQISLRQQQQQVELNSVIQSQQVKVPSLSPFTAMRVTLLASWSGVPTMAIASLSLVCRIW